MTSDLPGRASPILDPVDRSSEVLFGLIMALTFTSTFEVATAGRTDVKTMLIGALGCNLAWGIVDGVMFVVTRSIEKHRFHSRMRALQAQAPAEGARILEGELPDGWDQLIDAGDLERLAERARALSLSAPPGLSGSDYRAGVAVFFLLLRLHLPRGPPLPAVRGPVRGRPRLRRDRAS